VVHTETYRFSENDYKFTVLSAVRHVTAAPYVCKLHYRFTRGATRFGTPPNAVCKAFAGFSPRHVVPYHRHLNEFTVLIMSSDEPGVPPMSLEEFTSGKTPAKSEGGAVGGDGSPASPNQTPVILEPLLDGWTEHLDITTDRPMWYNTKTRATSWFRPTASNPPVVRGEWMEMWYVFCSNVWERLCMRGKVGLARRFGGLFRQFSRQRRR
jgi:hypothetical protein